MDIAFPSFHPTESNPRRPPSSADVTTPARDLHTSTIPSPTPATLPLLRTQPGYGSTDHHSTDPGPSTPTRIRSRSLALVLHPPPYIPPPPPPRADAPPRATPPIPIPSASTTTPTVHIDLSRWRMPAPTDLSIAEALAALDRLPPPPPPPAPLHSLRRTTSIEALRYPLHITSPLTRRPLGRVWDSSPPPSPPHPLATTWSWWTAARRRASDDLTADPLPGTTPAPRSANAAYLHQQQLLAYRPGFAYDYVHADDCRCPDVTGEAGYAAPPPPPPPLTEPLDTPRTRFPPTPDPSPSTSSLPPPSPASTTSTLVATSPPPAVPIPDTDEDPKGKSGAIPAANPICAWEGEWDAMLCSLCATVFDRVVAVPCCGAEVCANCVHHWVRHRKSERCPFCRAPLTDTHLLPAPDKQTRVDSLLVRCPFASLSCPWTGPRVAVPRHVSRCAVGLARSDPHRVLTDMAPPRCLHPYCILAALQEHHRTGAAGGTASVPAGLPANYAELLPEGIRRAAPAPTCNGAVVVLVALFSALAVLAVAVSAATQMMGGVGVASFGVGETRMVVGPWRRGLEGTEWIDALTPTPVPLVTGVVPPAPVPGPRPEEVERTLGAWWVGTHIMAPAHHTITPTTATTIATTCPDTPPLHAPEVRVAPAAAPTVDVAPAAAAVTCSPTVVVVTLHRVVVIVVAVLVAHATVPFAYTVQPFEQIASPAALGTQVGEAGAGASWSWNLQGERK
ncbi:hypothetical protein HDU96_001744, partial [Phlyctochytrium bullatum]